MCPECISVVALIVAGVVPTGALTALVVKKIRTKTSAQNIEPTTPTRGEQDGSPNQTREEQD